MSSRWLSRARTVGLTDRVAFVQAVLFSGTYLPIMRQTLIAGGFLLTAYCSPLTAQTLRDFTWLVGSRSVKESVLLEEHWMDPASNLMLGVSRTLRGDKVVEFEFLRIESRADGLYYVAQPGGRPPTDFKLTKWDGTEAVFENPAHDFPKRIIYRKQPDNVVVVRIDGGAGTQGQDFIFKP